MTRFRTLTAGVVVAGLLAGGAAFAQGPGRAGGGPGGRLGGPLGPGGPGDPGLPIRDLNVTEAQRDQIRDIMQRRAQEGRQVQERLRAALDAERKAMEMLPVNEGAIRAAAADLSNAEADAAIARARVRAEVFNVLTPEQQEQAKKLQAERDARVNQRRDRLGARRAQRQSRGK